MSCAILRMTLHEYFRVLVSLRQFPSFDPIRNQGAGGTDQIWIKSEGSFESSIGALKHCLTTAGVLRIEIVAMPQRVPSGRIGGIESDGAFQHGNRIFVWNRIMR